MKGIIKECETRLRRTYRGGALLDVFLGRQHGTDGFFPEDWISSFVEAKTGIIFRVRASRGWRTAD